MIYNKKIKHQINDWSGYTIKEAFDIEIECYNRLSKFPNFAKLLSFDEKNYTLEIEYVGESLDKSKVDDIPNLENQLSDIWDALEISKINHLDLQLKNFTIQNNILYLIDFDIAVIDETPITKKINNLFLNKIFNLGRLINDNGFYESIVYLHTKEYFIFYFKNLLNPNKNFHIQKEPYQIIDNIGGWRDCNQRWEHIEKFITEDKSSLSIDIGSAEGFFSKKIQNKTKGIVYSIEGSDFPYKRQLQYCLDEVKLADVQIFNFNLDSSNLNFILNKKYKYALFLSVLHWLDNPDFILEKISNISEYVILELPSLDDNVTINKSYMQRIKNDFNNIENYLEKNTNKKIIYKSDVPAHTSKTRTIYIMK